MKRIIISLALAMGVLVGFVAGPASADIPTPPESKLAVYMGHLEGTKINIEPGVQCRFDWNRGYMALSFRPTVLWTGFPKKRKGTTVGYYLEATSSIQAKAGVNGTFWKTLASKKYKSEKYRLIKNDALAELNENPFFELPVYYNVAQGSLDDRGQVTVRGVRDVAFGLDTTVWRGTYIQEGATACSAPGGA